MVAIGVPGSDAPDEHDLGGVARVRRHDGVAGDPGEVRAEHRAAREAAVRPRGREQVRPGACVADRAEQLADHGQRQQPSVDVVEARRRRAHRIQRAVTHRPQDGACPGASCHVTREVKSWTGLGGEQRRLALGVEPARDEASPATAPGARPRARRAATPRCRARSRRACRNSRPGGARARVRDRVERAVLRLVGQPQRQLVERLDALLEQELLAHPGELRRSLPVPARQARDQLAEGRRRPAHVEDPRRQPLGLARPRTRPGRVRPRAGRAHPASRARAPRRRARGARPTR